jgi:phosphoribosylformylglycinamidine (FGAM) synthase PurS component
MVWIVEVGYKKDVTDSVGFLTKKEIEDLGIEGVEEVRSINTYTITGEIGEEEVKKVCEELLSDNQIQHYGYMGKGVNKSIKHEIPNAWLVEVGLKPGVMDAVGMSTLNAIEILGIDGAREVKTGTKYLIIGDIPEETVRKICRRLLVNNLIQHYRVQKIGGK